MNVAISHKQDTNFLKDGVYEIVGINNNIVDIKCIDKIVKVDIDIIDNWKEDSLLVSDDDFNEFYKLYGKIFEFGRVVGDCY